MRSLAVAGLAVSVATLAAAAAFAPAVFADDEPDVDVDLCMEAEAELKAALQLVLGYNPDAYPGDVVPALDDLDLDLLNGILGDADLGAGARAEVEAAVAALLEVDAVCDESPVTTTPPTATPTPTTTKPAPVGKDCDDFTSSQAQAVLNTDRSDPHDLDSDGDGTACEEDGFDQIGTVPAGAVATGGGPA